MVQLICYAQRQVVRSAAYVQRIRFLNMQVGCHWGDTNEGYPVMGPAGEEWNKAISLF